jgi:hypothetical protein
MTSLNVPYIVPGENGSRADIQWLHLTKGSSADGLEYDIPIPNANSTMHKELHEEELENLKR